MNIRENIEELEIKCLSQYATKSRFSLGRDCKEEPCDIRTCFQRDRDRIIHSKAFRRLMHKTQVFISPDGDHYRTRLTHTLEVSQISRTIARALRLNEDLTEAIALGHDLGHTPFGHLGEEDLNRKVKDGFHHNEQSVRVVEKIENNGKGLNLCKEVRDGILNHRGAGTPKTLEGKIVQISDKIAYVNHDIEDAIRAGIITDNDLPIKCVDMLGKNSRERINFLIRNIITNSTDKNDIIMDKEVKEKLYELRKYLFENVYVCDRLELERIKYGDYLGKLFEYYKINVDKIPDLYKDMIKNGEEKERAICDYIAGMTDRFALKTYDTVFNF